MNLKKLLDNKNIRILGGWSVFGLAYGSVGGYLFYKSVVMSFVLAAIFFIIYFKKALVEAEEKSIEKQEDDFYNWLISISESLETGMNMKNAILSSKNDIEKGVVYDEIMIILRKISLNMTIKNALEDFRERTNSKQIKKWINIILISYIHGSDLSKAIKNNKEMIILLKRTKKEAKAMLAKQKMNIFIIKIIPFVIIALITGSSPDFASALYQNGGRIIMTFVFISIIIADFIAERLVRI